MILDYKKIQDKNTVVICYYQPYELTFKEIYDIYYEFTKVFSDNKIIFLPKDTTNFSTEQKDDLVSQLKKLIETLEESNYNS